MKRIIALLSTTLCSLLMMCSYAGNKQGQTSFTNPVIYADVPDIDVIRVGSDYYMVSTTMHLMPGVPIMKSKDLVNWQIISYVVPQINDSPAYNLEGGNVYGQGQWATSLRYHNGKFYVFFATNRPQKTYIYSAVDPSGKWEKVMDLNQLYHDTSLFFDDDGRVYVAGGSGVIRVQELKSDLSGVKQDGLNVEVINGGQCGFKGLLEGTHLCKYNGKYYMFLIWWPAGGIRTQLAFRADKIEGPYEQKVILSNDMDRKGAGVAQGCIIDTPEGNWYGYLFQDRGAVGRVPVLMPCRWEDGWPMLGDKDGKVPLVMNLPVSGQKPTPLVISDHFKSSTLALNWQWNHNPDNNLWSLTERKGYMRLKTGKVVQSIFEARNMLSQRTEGPACRGVVSLDVSKMREGDVAGLSAYCSEPGIISVRIEGNKKYIVMTDRNTEKERVELRQNLVYLRLDCDFNSGTDKANFFYSLNNKEWTKLGTEFQMVYNLEHFMGNRFGIFNYATKAPGGYVDIDFFDYTRNTSIAQEKATLKDALKGKFHIGTALNVKQITGKDTESLRILGQQFDAIVAENCMKSQELLPEKGKYDFAMADRFVALGEKQDLFITGHTLIWHSQLPKWFCVDEDGNNVSPEELKARMKEYISTVVSRYKGRIKGWDVVNEAILEDGSYRKSKFYEILGEEFIPLAFQYAHEADPKAELYYNDYNEWYPGKRATVIKLIKTLKERGIRIDGIGLQGHIGMDSPSLQEYEETILDYAKAGVKVMVTELDLSILPSPKRGVGADIATNFEYQKELNPYTEGVPEAASIAWNNRMNDFFKLFIKHAGQVSRVTLWGIADGDSWKNGFPVRGRTDYPLLFDRQYRAKPVVEMIIKEAGKL